MKWIKLLANLGYGSRRQVTALFDEERVTDAAGEPLPPEARVDYACVRIDGEPLDPPPGTVILLNKPVGYTCSTKDPGRIVYDLLPSRFRVRDPLMSPIGRLDRDTSGLLLFTDDGQFLHRVISPKAKVTKVYEVVLAQDLRGDEAATFAGGELMLDSETTPLLPVPMTVLGPRQARLTLMEGRYHQVRRMFAAVGNHVEQLARLSIGGLTLGDLPAGEWRVLGDADRAAIFQPPAA
ncbi:pseudouridine synthase [Tahibacter amnicola]|uniref:Pseudouridine synthase n=1 Tax=Tahibacter amnicola TaxID=2976241 RepID=A0ABY6BKQ0_9GAMM|nr:16S rRNA pseudouridine(516) synthase [Tahibacter amnicola]UXI70344.1 pseudouridine synthase [Tahibacter amnicola]